MTAADHWGRLEEHELLELALQMPTTLYDAARDNPVHESFTVWLAHAHDMRLPVYVWLAGRVAWCVSANTYEAVDRPRVRAVYRFVRVPAGFDPEPPPDPA